jgi:PTH1 family peptidyl-tRNA hydrolase
MLLIAGLGNPGDKYKNNRHNIGFMAIDAIADHHGMGPYKSKFNAHVCDGVIETAQGRSKVLLLKPMTFMNESGRSVAQAAKFYKIPLENIFVFHDELDLEPGKFRIKTGGGIAGHNGLRSIRDHVGANFHRARMGIGHPGHKDRVHSYVLSDFTKSDREWVDALTDACARSADLLAVSEFNKYQTKVNHLAPAPTARPRRN